MTRRWLWALVLHASAPHAGLADDMAALRHDPSAALKLAAKQCEDTLSYDNDATREAVRLGLPLALTPSRERALLLICRGYLAEIEGQLKTALDDYNEAEKVAVAAGDTEQQSQALAVRGEVRHRLGAYDAALQDLQAAHRLAPKDSNLQAYALNAIANFYSDPQVGQYAQALTYYRQLHALHLAKGKTDDAATALFNQASTLHRLNRLRDAEALFREVLALYERLQDRTSISETQRALASLLLQDQRPAEALPLTNQALALAHELKDPELRLSATLTRGAVLRRLGRLRDAEADLGEALKYYSQQGAPRFQARATGELAEVAAAQGQWAKAYALRSEQFKLEEGLRTQQQQELSSRLRVQFDVEHMEQRAQAAQLETKLRDAALRDAERIRQLQWALIVSGGLLASVVAFWAWRVVQRARRFATLAYSDALTGVPNRRSIIERLDTALARGDAVQALMIDIDHFKRINDLFGHEAGDSVLRSVAQALQEALDDGAHLGRLGGEEFLVVASDDAGIDIAELAERMRSVVEGLRWSGPLASLRVTTSVGAARSRGTGIRSEHLLQHADEALYAAKEGGRNRVVVAPD
jgi:diguanylate cyclase (GGDEF)-like protein